MTIVVRAIGGAAPRPPATQGATDASRVRVPTQSCPYNQHQHCDSPFEVLLVKSQHEQQLVAIWPTAASFSQTNLVSSGHGAVVQAPHYSAHPRELGRGQGRRDVPGGGLSFESGCVLLTHFQWLLASMQWCYMPTDAVVLWMVISEHLF